MVAPTRFVGWGILREGAETLPYDVCSRFAAVAERRGRRSLHDCSRVVAFVLTYMLLSYII